LGLLRRRYRESPDYYKNQVGFSEEKKGTAGQRGRELDLYEGRGIKPVCLFKERIYHLKNTPKTEGGGDERRTLGKTLQGKKSPWLVPYFKHTLVPSSKWDTSERCPKITALYILAS